MIRGVLIRDTTAGVPARTLQSCARCYAEITIIERLGGSGDIDPAKLVPMISPFLGAKTMAVKSAELEYAVRITPSRSVLYFFDAKNIRFGLEPEFLAELRRLSDAAGAAHSSVYLPYAFFENDELRSILSALARLEMEVLVSFEEASDDARVGDVLSLVCSYCSPASIGCVFSDESRMSESRKLLEAHAIHEASFYA